VKARKAQERHERQEADNERIRLAIKKRTQSVKSGQKHSWGLEIDCGKLLTDLMKQANKLRS